MREDRAGARGSSVARGRNGGRARANAAEGIAAESSRRSAARLDADAGALAARVAKSLPREALERDLALVVTGRDESRIATDEVLRRYRTERAVFHLAPALAAGIARETAGLGVDESVWRTIARTAVRAASLVPKHDRDGDLENVVRQSG